MADKRISGNSKSGNQDKFQDKSKTTLFTIYYLDK